MIRMKNRAINLKEIIWEETNPQSRAMQALGVDTYRLPGNKRKEDLPARWWGIGDSANKLIAMASSSNYPEFHKPTVLCLLECLNSLDKKHL